MARQLVALRPIRIQLRFSSVWRGVSLAVALVAFVSAALPAAAQEMPGRSPAEAAAQASSAARADDGAHVVNQHLIDARTLDITVDSPALGTTANVRLLLPPDWFRQPDGRWPVLYLLHPAFVDYTGWTQNTDVEALTAHTDVLVVMPEAGFIPTYSNWWNHGAFGPPAWETFHLTELRQILARGFRAGQRLAIAGASLGGLDAMSYAARHPTLFRASAAFSGVLDSRNTALGLAVGLRRLFQQFTPAHDAMAIWGDPVQQADIWAAHNPLDLEPRLHRDIRLFVSSGNGQPGPLDPPGTPNPTDPVEPSVLVQSQEFAARARQLDLQLTTDFYGPGSHSFPYWQRERHRCVALLMDAVAARPNAK